MVRVLAILAAMSVACRDKPPPEDHTRELAHAMVAGTVHDLEGILVTARTRATGSDGRDEAAIDHENFYRSWWAQCAAVSQVKKSCGDPTLVARLDALCGVELPLADLAEIDATTAAEHPSDGRDPFGCSVFAVAFTSDYKAASSAGRPASELAPLLARYRGTCPHSATLDGWPPGELQ